MLASRRGPRSRVDNIIGARELFPRVLRNIISHPMAFLRYERRTGFFATKSAVRYLAGRGSGIPALDTSTTRLSGRGAAPGDLREDVRTGGRVEPPGRKHVARGISEAIMKRIIDGIHAITIPMGLVPCPRSPGDRRTMGYSLGAPLPSCISLIPAAPNFPGS